MNWIRAKTDDNYKIWLNLENMEELYIKEEDGDYIVYAENRSNYYKLFEGSRTECEDFLNTLVRPKTIRRVSNGSKRKR